jgi:hypothetical protein
MKKVFLLALIILYTNEIHGQYVSPIDRFYGFSLEEKVEYYFNTFKDGISYRSVPRYASSIFIDHGYLALPFMKERLENANYFTYTTEPKDITLELIAYIIDSFDLHSDPRYEEYIPYYYVLTEDEILWFYNEYMHRIDEYVLAVRVIDEVVFWHSYYINGLILPQAPDPAGESFDIDRCYHAIEVDYPCFGRKSARYFGEDLKRYFEERLGIEDLTVDYSFFHTEPFPYR